MDLSHLEAIIGDAIVNCLSHAQIPIKEAAMLMEMNETNFRKALTGEAGRTITLVRLIKLPYRFWLHFGPQIMWLVTRKHMIEIGETFAAMKACEEKVKIETSTMKRSA